MTASVRVPDDAVFSLAPTHAPTITVPSGSTLQVGTMDCFSDTIVSEDQLFSSIGWEQVNPATGPIAVEGARVGGVLRVDILDIVTASRGTMTTHPEYGAVPGTIEERTRRIEVRDGRVLFAPGVEFPVSPMIGVIGTAPAEDDVPTGTPGDHGGNMDCKRITTGTSIYLPVNVPGALLAIGDVHAAMGDGEVAVCGLEIAATLTVRVTVVVAPDLPTPFVAAPDAVMAIASRPTLDDAAREATRRLQRWLVEVTELDATDALMLLSLAGDLRICQVVDPEVTVRMEIRRDVLDAYGVTLP